MFYMVDETTIKISPEDREKLGKHPKKRVHELLVKEAKHQEELAKKNEEVANLKAQLEKHTDGKSRPEEQSSENKTFDFEKVTEFCPFPIWDRTLKSYKCSNPNCPLDLPKHKLLTTYTCVLCNEQLQYTSIHKETTHSKRMTKNTQHIAQSSPTQSTTLRPPTLQDPKDRRATELFLKAMSGQDPFKNVPCPYDARMPERNMQVFYCAKNMELPPTDKKIRYQEIDHVGRCKNCNVLHEKAKEINARRRATRQTKDYTGQRVIFPHGEIPESAYQ